MRRHIPPKYQWTIIRDVTYEAIMLGDRTLSCLGVETDNPLEFQ